MMSRFLHALLAGLLLALVPAMPALAQDDALVEGRDYVVIPDGQPWRPLDGKVEVVEVFGYWCHVCDDFQPLVDAWKQKLPKDVRFSYVPAAFSPNDAYARAYFASESLGGLARTHNATYHAIHHAQSLPMRGATYDEAATLYASFGLDARGVAGAMQSAATDEKMREAYEFAVRSGVEGTPTMIVNGVYRVQGKSLHDLLRITDLLVARERAAGKGG